MEKAKLYILVQLRKRKDNKYEVTFLYSKEEKNFKRAMGCSPEVQKLALQYAYKELLKELADEPYHWREEYMQEECEFYYFDCKTCENRLATKENITAENWGQRAMILDSFVVDNDDDYVIWHVVNNAQVTLTNYGLADNGKLFMKPGHGAKKEIKCTEEMEDIDEVIDIFEGRI